MAAAREIEACGRALARAGETLVGRLTRGVARPEPWSHYPPGGDVYDPQSHAQFYFHFHPEADPAPTAGPREAGQREAGHFHTFLRPAGMPYGLAPERPASAPAGGRDAPSHLVAIAVDQAGLPVRLFTTNRWATDEAWYGADAVVAMLDRFAVEPGDPSWAISRWLTALFRLYRPEMAVLLRARDEALRRWQAAHPEVDVLEDGRLETASTMRIDLAARIRAVDGGMAR